ncbi:MAG: dephospho-CoA kinase [Bacteroides sp.]|nr:dephospho-CoA kinase [Ruminococcus flavefaciens]MCM1555422.1 dephospho-CoA kinase [Bacteroides sp.]
MLRIGLTGGMGCGKSTIAHIFSALGIPVYHADERAKHISRQAETKACIARLFGREAAQDKKALAAIVFNDPQQLARLNALIHPLVFSDMEAWFSELETLHTPPPYALVEAAILFESGMDRMFYGIINIEAPVQEQIERCMARDRCTEPEVKARLARQLSAEERRKRAHFTISNASEEPVLPSVLEIDSLLRQEASKPDSQGR